jgi:hypothetical protein
MNFETILAQHFYVPKLSSIRKAKCVAWVPETIPGKGQGGLPRCRVLVELLLKT